MTKTFLALAALLFAAVAHAADYTMSPDGSMSARVQYAFADNVTFTPIVGGIYSVDVVPQTVFYGCSTRTCKRSSVQTSITSEYLASWPLVNGNTTQALLAGVPYTLHIVGQGMGTGLYAGIGAYTVGIKRLGD